MLVCVLNVVRGAVRNVLVLDLELRDDVGTNVKLPHTIFTSKTLVVLTLWEAFLDVPGSVWLPSLKSLNLHSVKYENEDSLLKLLSGCPVLENLYMVRWILDTLQVLNISVPTLKHLTVIWYRDYFQDEDLEDLDDQGCKLVVDAPQLEHIYLSDYCTDEFLFRNLRSLSKASLFVGSSDLSFIDDGLRIYRLLSGIPNVKFLDAHFSTDVDDYMLPTFHNLTELKLGGGGDDSWNLKLLSDFLQCSPNLETLILEGNVLDTSDKSWNPPQEVPSCLLLHLKKIRIQKFSGKNYELRVIGPIHNGTTRNCSKSPHDSNGTTPITTNSVTRLHAPPLCLARLSFLCHSHTHFHALPLLAYVSPALACTAPTAMGHSATVRHQIAISANPSQRGGNGVDVLHSEPDQIFLYLLRSIVKAMTDEANALCSGIRVTKLGFCEIENGGSGSLSDQEFLLVHIAWLILLGFFVYIETLSLSLSLSLSLIFPLSNPQPFF
ncbi:hypothetical protein TEA_018418 [Camellia sinensis var. sinensis]|uniref:F-box/LRR-repeat protein 15/At3g58940/PEG3-like LRR domain-containing protein n=1 Tax=Camellia sinensis var. sinensis TaxID=542762 RepID=A0A4S4CW19_CAMSN|nr:hypothetical protein TEA_018418 [Camellia sinensis var. sinensis]